jgi:hypothetical protein
MSENQFARKMRDRLIKSYEYQAQRLKVEEYAIPILQRAIDKISGSVQQTDGVIPDIEEALVNIQDSLNIIKSANESERENIHEMLTALGHLLEIQVDADKFTHEAAALATIIQYFDIAAKGSKSYWVYLLETVDPPVFLDALAQVDSLRLGIQKE